MHRKYFESILFFKKRIKKGADISYFNGLALSVFRLISAWVNPLGVRSSDQILRINY